MFDLIVVVYIRFIKKILNRISPTTREYFSRRDVGSFSPGVRTEGIVRGQFQPGFSVGVPFDREPGDSGLT